MSINKAIENLEQHLAKLKIQWEETMTFWDDSVSQGFESKYFQPIESQATSTLQSLENLADLMEKARRDIEDE